MTFMACSIGHTHVKVLKTRLPVRDKNLLKGADVKTGCHPIADGTDYLVVGYGKGRGCHDSAEHPVVYVAVQIFHQLSVGKSGVGLQYHEGYLCRREQFTPEFMN